MLEKMKKILPAEDMEGLTTVGKVIDYLQSKGIESKM